MFGFVSIGAALFHMTSIDLQISFAYAAKLRFLQSIGLAFLFVLINTLIYIGVPPGKNNDVSGLSNLARNIGGSAGTSFFTTVLARHQQVHQQYLVQHVFGSNSAFLQRSGALTSTLLRHFTAKGDAQIGAFLRLYRQRQMQPSVLSYVDVLRSLSFFCASMVPLVLLMKKPPLGMKASSH